MGTISKDRIQRKKGSYVSKWFRIWESIHFNDEVGDCGAGDCLPSSPGVARACRVCIVAIYAKVGSMKVRRFTAPHTKGTKITWGWGYITVQHTKDIVLPVTESRHSYYKCKVVLQVGKQVWEGQWIVGRTQRAELWSYLELVKENLELSKTEQVRIGPASKKQELFLNSDATITLAGGAAKQNWSL